MAAVWEPTRVKAQLRLTAQRLGQLQYRMDSQGQITRKDIAILLQQGNIALARAKAQKLIRDDRYADLLQTLEMQVGVVLEHMAELERNTSPGPVMIEAVSSIIYAAPRTDSRDLQGIRDLLIHKLGPDFVRSATENRDGYVAVRVIKILNAPAPSATWLDQYLFNIAKAHAIEWRPDLQPHEKVNAISEMLDPSSNPEIDMNRLRQLCAQGLPEDPPWIRPRVWRLFLGTLPPLKTAWPEEARKQRDNYYDLVRRLLEPFTSLPPPTSPLDRMDATLVDVSKDLSHVPAILLSKLEEEPEVSVVCPLDSTASVDVKITCAGALDERLHLIREFESSDSESIADSTPEIRLEGTPEIRLEEPEDVPKESSIPQMHLDVMSNHSTDSLHIEGGTPEISLSAPDTPASTHSSLPTTLLASKAYTAAGAHPKHASALLRLLYIHSCLNPANRAPQVASLLVPIYSALADEADPDDLAHVEADAFWLFETVVGEFADLEDPDLCNVWMKKFGGRLSWADVELAENLQSKGLDPALPHYSYRWLTPLLTHTLPPYAVLTVWDAILSRPMRERDANPKLEFLLDVCTSMLLCARDSLTRLGRHGKSGSNLWGDENAIVPSSASSVLAAKELDDAFVEGMELLRNYPVRKAGGIEAVLQVAHDLATRRQAESQATAQASTTTLGARLKNSVWGFSSQPSIQEVHEDSTEDELSDEYEDEEEPHEAPPKNGQQGPTISSRLANTVWKGFTNKSAMEAPPSPTYPASPVSPSPRQPSSPLANPPLNADDELLSTPTPGKSKFWGYAEKLRDSDTAATLAKVSTNWKFKAIDAWSNRAAVAASLTPALRSAPTPPQKTSQSRPESLQVEPPVRSFGIDGRRSSMPEPDRSDAYSPPARPAFFRPVRDSWMPEPRKPASPSGTPDAMSPASDTGFDYGSTRRRNNLSLAHLGDHFTGSPSSSAKSGPPKPLLLSSSVLMTAGHSSPKENIATVADKQWADSVRATRPEPRHRNSQSSMSSLSPEVISGSRRADSSWAAPRATNGSRIVPLNRKTPSPMARHARRNGSVSSAPSSPPSSHSRLPTGSSETSAKSTSQVKRDSGWTQADSVDSSTTLPSPPRTPASIIDETVQVQPREVQRGSMVLAEPADLSDVPSEHTHTPRKPSLSRLDIEDSDSSAQVTLASAPMRTPRIRSKRFPPRLQSLRSKDTGSRANSVPIPTQLDPNSLAAPEWPGEESESTTPRASTFDSTMVSSGPGSLSRRSRKVSGEKSGDEIRPRKLSGDGRARKVSSERQRKTSGDGAGVRQKRESAAVDGDDEGYDDLLSAYESEDSLVR
ncbi:regulator of Vps4 activity in the MVB pathway-domain-containing protein [Cristinia sonorae]|uniref:Regulator of Vps4 activity in the MVB pathway-domain-containing protein n=1 Tax=Cristinia sonorae TaxID=1940300 RepID=A0A8K0UWP0_9AGAR|nr:regulator of Vps4 activity in the MVB pathway-domain-containing protein [Cristinia sonorae]